MEASSWFVLALSFCESAGYRMDLRAKMGLGRVTQLNGSRRRFNSDDAWPRQDLGPGTWGPVSGWVGTVSHVFCAQLCSWDPVLGCDDYGKLSCPYSFKLAIPRLKCEHGEGVKKDGLGLGSD